MDQAKDILQKTKAAINQLSELYLHSHSLIDEQLHAQSVAAELEVVISDAQRDLRDVYLTATARIAQAAERAVVRLTFPHISELSDPLGAVDSDAQATNEENRS